MYLQGACLGGVMGAVTRLDPNTTQNLASQPGANAGELSKNSVLSLASCMTISCCFEDRPKAWLA